MKKLLYFRKKEVEDIKDESVVPVSRWLCKSKDNNKTYILSIFYDTHSFMYNNILVKEFGFITNVSPYPENPNHFYEFGENGRLISDYDINDLEFL